MGLTDADYADDDGVLASVAHARIDERLAVLRTVCERRATRWTGVRYRCNQ